jgi:hypothetical protein
MPQDAILGCFYLLNGLFAIRCSETQDLRPGLLSAVPTGLNWERVVLWAHRFFDPVKIR